jgi:dihydroorotase
MTGKRGNVILIKNAKILLENGTAISDVLIENGKIKSIEKNIQLKEDVKVIDANGAYLLPGLIDLNVRLANSELHKDSLNKLTKTSLHGGVTTSVIMPDFRPRLDSSTLLEHFMLKAENEEADLHVAAPLVNVDEDRLNNIATLLKNGATAIWAKSSINSNLLRRGIQYAKMKNAPLFCECYDANLDDDGVINEGQVSFRLGLSGISKLSESSAVAKVAEIASSYNVKIVFKSLSTKRSIDIVKNYKKHCKDMYSEVSIHHLCKNDESCDGFNTYAKTHPPLREESERLAILDELASIDVLTSAHSPRSVVYKDVSFEDAAFGIGSIEEYLSICYTYLVKSDIISMGRLMQMCSKTPAKILGLENCGKIEIGFRADMVLFDEKESQVINNKTSIYNKEKLFGKVLAVFKNGKIIEL